MEKHNECVPISQLPHDIIKTNMSNICLVFIFTVTVSHRVFEVGDDNKQRA